VAPSDRTLLAGLLAVVLGATALIWIPLERHYANDPAEKARRGEVTGLGELSMVRSTNATAAVEEMRRRSPAESRVQNLVLRPTSVDATVVVPADGTGRTFSVTPGLHVAAAKPTPASSDYGVTFRRIDATVPETMARSVLGELHRDEGDLDYVVASVSSTGGPMEWLLYLKSGRIRDRAWRAEADGGHLRRNGT
jgi:hypothetical protein